MASPEDLGLPRLMYTDIAGGDSIEESAALFLKIIQGEGTPAQQAAVIANAGMALYCADQQSGFESAMKKAEEALLSGRAFQVFKQLING
jgi:anthranilate phosphoribosyltransferase